MSSISPLANPITVTSSTSSPEMTPSSFKQDVRDLTDALSSNDLAGAKTAYAQVEQGVHAIHDHFVNQGASSSGTGSGTSSGLAATVHSDLTSVGSALQAGNISGAASALVNLHQSIAALRASNLDGGVAEGSAPSEPVPEGSTFSVQV